MLPDEGPIHLVQQQDMRSQHAQHCKGYTTLLTTRQSPDLLQAGQSSDPERSQMRSVFLLDLSRESGLQKGHRGRFNIKLIDMMLSEVGYSTSVVVVGCPGQGLQVASKELDECRLPGPVRSNDSYPTVEIDVEIDISEYDLFRRVSKGSLVKLE